MLCEQTEEHGNFIISLAAVFILSFLYSKLQTSIFFAGKKMLEKKCWKIS